MHDHYDDQGNSRTYFGQINSPYISMGSTAEQWAAGVGHYDSAWSAQSKVEMYRRAQGLDPYTGLTKEAAAHYWANSGTGIGFGIFKWLFIIGVIFAILAASSGLWKEAKPFIGTAADKIETWGLAIAIDGQRLAPFSAYGKYIPKKSASPSTPPAEINEKAKKLFAPHKRLSDKVVAYWGPAAWACLSENLACLDQAGALEESYRDIRLLGLLYLDLARRKGSPDAAADIGLYVMTKGSPMGKDAGLALYHWDRGVKENPKAIRADILLNKAKESVWARSTASIAAFLREDIW